MRRSPAATAARWAAVVTVAALVGCDLASGLSEFAVGSPDDEPSAGGGGSGGQGAGGSSGGAGGLQLCAIEPQDDFEDGAIGPQWMIFAPSGTGTIVEADGWLHLTMDRGGGNRWMDLSTVAAHDLSGCGAAVRFSGTIQAGDVGYFVVGNDADNYLGFLRVQSELRFYGFSGGVYQAYASVRYDDVLHDRWWLRTADGAAEWWTSSNGSAWKMLHSEPTQLDATAMHVLLGAGVDPGFLSGGFQVSFDDVNRLP